MNSGDMANSFGRSFLAGTTIDLATTPADVTLAGQDDGAQLGASTVGGDLNGDGIDEIGRAHV